MKDLATWLKERHRKASCDTYYRAINIYLENCPKAKTATYKDITDYLSTQRLRYHNPKTVNAILMAIKKYYEYLLDTQQREDHPCCFLNLKDKLHKDVQLQDLFTETELLSMMDYESKRSKGKMGIRNKALLGLLIYQGLGKGEIKRLKTTDVNLQTATVYIGSSTNSNARELKLKSVQVMTLHQYLTEVRPLLLKEKDMESEKLFISVRGKEETGSSIKYLMEKLQKRFPERKLNAVTIRQSVIANLLKQGKNIRVVQAFAGHKKPSATERYKPPPTEELKAGIDKYHPLK